MRIQTLERLLYRFLDKQKIIIIKEIRFLCCFSILIILIFLSSKSFTALADAIKRYGSTYTYRYILTSFFFFLVKLILFNPLNGKFRSGYKIDLNKSS